MNLTFCDAAGYVKAFLLALSVSAILAWPVYAFLVRIKSRQTVSEFLGETHQMKQGTPTMGGLIALPGFAVAAWASGSWRYLGLYLGFAMIGLLDDFVVPRLLTGKRGLGWVPKLALELAVAVPCVTLFLGEIRERDLEAIFVVLFFANAYNFADGLDGLAGGLLLIIAPVLLVLGSQWVPSAGIASCAALCGAVIPFLFLNSPPAKIFMGDVGSLPIGATLGMVVVHLYSGWGASGMRESHIRNAIYLDLGLLLLSLVLIAELVPVPLQIISVKLRKGKRLFPRTPIHHTFEHWGWPESKITWTFLLVQLVCAGLAIAAAVFGAGRLTP